MKGHIITVQDTVKIGTISGFTLKNKAGDSIRVSSKSLPEEGTSLTVSGTLMKDTLFGWHVKNRALKCAACCGSSMRRLLMAVFEHTRTKFAVPETKGFLAHENERAIRALKRAACARIAKKHNVFLAQASYARFAFSLCQERVRCFERNVRTAA